MKNVDLSPAPTTAGHEQARNILQHATTTVAPFSLVYEAELYGNAKRAKQMARSLVVRLAAVRSHERNLARKRKGKAWAHGPYDNIHFSMLTSENGHDTEVFVRRADNFDPCKVRDADGSVRTYKEVFDLNDLPNLGLGEEQ